MTSLLAAELLKLRTVRVPYVFLGIVILLAVGSAAIFVISDSLDDEPDAWLMLAQGANFATILATILGILIVTNEYRHGTITSTFLVDPERERVLGAKLGAATVVGVVFAVVAFVVAVAVAYPWQAARDEALTVDGTVVEALARLVAAYVVSCALGIGVGAIIQNQVGAIVATFVWFFVVEAVISTVAGLLTEFGDDPVSQYLPGSALQAIVGFEQAEDVLLSPVAGTVLALVYTAILVGLGALSMARRDP